MDAWDKKALPIPTLTPLTLCYLHFLNISFFYFNECLSDLICGGKREKKEFGQRTRVDCVKSFWYLPYSLLFHLQNSELPNLHLLVLEKSRSRVELIKSELPRTQIQTLQTWSWETPIVKLFFIIIASRLIPEWIIIFE